VLCLINGGIATLDEGYLWSSVSRQGIVTSECHFCAMAQLMGDRCAPSTPRSVAEDGDEDVMVVSGSGHDGLMVIPREHVGGLEELAVSHRAHVLAALRRVTQSIQDRNPGTAARIVVLIDPPDSAGHVCFRVLAEASKGR
jgi:hypothetical protein